MFRMSDGRLWVATAILATAALVLLPPPAGSGGADGKHGPSGAMQALDSWAAQRAYPGNLIPADGFIRAWERSKLVPRADETGTDGRGAEPWTSLGPNNIGGRTLALAVNPDNPQVLYAGSASGGLWKSTVGGVGANAWDLVETGYPILAVSSIALDPADSDVIYIGTGEAYRYQTSDGGEMSRLTRGSYGIGILKSNDGGNNWSHSLDWSYDQNRGVWMIAVHPTDSNIVYAATTEGIYKSTDAGGDWALVHDVIMGTDVRIHPVNHEMIFSAHGNFGSEGHGIYRSTDGGGSWSKLTSGLPASWTGKTRLGLSPMTPSRVYASIANSEDGLGLYRSTDNGQTWQQVNGTDYQLWQGFYSHYVLPSPHEANTLFTGGIAIHRSTDGGATLTEVSNSSTFYAGTPPPEGPIGGPQYVHSDQHFAVWHPTDPETIFFTGDGGVFKTTDGGDSFASLIGGYVTSQFYNGLGLSATDRNKVVGGMQDNGSACYRGELPWERWQGMDGTWCAVNQQDDDVFYYSGQFIYLYRTSDDGDFWNLIYPPVTGDETYAFIGPYVLSSTNPEVLYAGRCHIYKSTNGGWDWQMINNGERLNGYNPAICMDVASSTEDLVFTATAAYDDRPRLYRTTNGNIWEEVTGTLPDRYISDITIDPTDAARVYVTLMGFGTSHLFHSSDGGDSWIDIGQGLPDIPFSAVIVDPHHPQVIYVGGDLGVYLSPDRGQTWYSFMEGMGVAMVNDLKVFAPDRLLRAATHGNGVYERPLFEPGGDLSAPRVIAGPGPAEPNPPRVRVYPPENGAVHLYEFTAYGAEGYGVNVAAGDPDGDDRDEIITGAGPGAIYGPHVRGFDVDGTPLPGFNFLAYGTHKYGVNAVAGDIDGDGFDEIITGAGPGAVFGPHVRGWDYDNAAAVTAIPGVSYFAYGTPKWGVNVSTGDIDGDGFDEIVTGAGPGTVYGPHVRGWNVDGGAAVSIPGVSYFAYSTNQFGVNVTCGDVDGDGIDEIVTGPGPGSVFGAHVRGWNHDGSGISPLPGLSFFAFSWPENRFGARVSARADLDGDGRDEIVAGLGPDPLVGSTVSVFSYDGSQVSSWATLESFTGMSHGATVASGRF